jgi:16S rRNA (guanine527-N7)-methyltransferase
MGVPFTAEAFSAASGATDAQMGDLESYRALLSDWNGRMNLVGPTALEAFWPRHAWDSAQLRFSAPNARVWADVGSGAGFPGIVLAILMKATPGVKVHLVESMLKRCRFLNEVSERLALPAVVHNARAETLTLQGVEVVTARACAPMDRLLEFSWPLLRQGAFGLFLKGKTVDVEVAEARMRWIFRASTIPSRSDPSGVIVKIESLSRA